MACDEMITDDRLSDIMDSVNDTGDGEQNPILEMDCEANNQDFEDSDNIENILAPENTDTDSMSSKAKDKIERVTQLPLSRIKHIMKLDPDVALVNQDASFLITKATELFINFLSKESYSFTLHKKKKIVSKQDVDSAVNTDSPLFFLQGCLEN